MKKLILVVLIGLLFQLSFGQTTEIVVNPYCQMTNVGLVSVVEGSDTVVASSGFTGIDSGMVVYGAGIPEGTIVVYNGSDDTLGLSNDATRTIAEDSLCFNYLLDQTYASGQWIGIPFQIYSSSIGGTTKLVSVLIADSSDQLDDVDLVFFNAWSDTYGLDTATVSLDGENYSKVLGYVALTTAVDLGTVRILTKDDINMLLPRGTLYGRLIARSTPKFTSTRCLKIRFRFIN